MTIELKDEDIKSIAAIVNTGNGKFCFKIDGLRFCIEFKVTIEPAQE